RNCSNVEIADRRASSAASTWSTSSTEAPRRRWLSRTRSGFSRSSSRSIMAPKVSRNVPLSRHRFLHDAQREGKHAVVSTPWRIPRTLLSRWDSWLLATVGATLGFVVVVLLVLLGFPP